MLNLRFKIFECIKIRVRNFVDKAGKATSVSVVDKAKGLVYGGDLPIPTPRKSFGSFLFDRLTVKNREDDIFQICTKTHYAMTTKTYVEQAIAIAERLKDEGIQKGDFILLVGNNSLNMNTALAGIFFLGAVPFPVSYKTSIEEFNILLKNVNPKFCACDRANLFTFKGVLKTIENYDMSKIFLLDNSDDSDKSGLESFEEFIKGRKKKVDSFKPAQVDNPEEELALVVKGARYDNYGKGIGITHYNLTSVITRFEASLGNLEENKKRVELMVHKVMWMSGMYSLFVCCCLGSKLIVMDKFDEVSFLKAIEEYKVTSSYLYTSKMWQVYKYNYERQYDLSSCQFIQTFDGNLPPNLVSGMKEKLNLTLKSSFGINELTGLALESSDLEVPDSIGQLVPEMYGKVIVDKTLGKAKPFEKGEIYFKGPSVTKGYINEPEATRKLFDKDGFLHSGLYGYYDNEGFFFIIDKIHQVIKYKKYEISPKVLEGVIKSLKSVKDALVSEIQHPTDGYYPIAFVTLQAGETIMAEDIIKYVNDFLVCRFIFGSFATADVALGALKIGETSGGKFTCERVRDHEKLRGGVVFLSKIPRSRDTGILRRELVKNVLKKYKIPSSEEDKEVTEEDECKLSEEIRVFRATIA